MYKALLARANERARMRNVRDFPQTKLDSEINARFLLNKHGDPHFLFYKFNENNILNNWEKNWQKSMATFLANEINATDRDVTGPTAQVQIMFRLRWLNRVMQDHEARASDLNRKFIFSFFLLFS